MLKLSTLGRAAKLTLLATALLAASCSKSPTQQVNQVFGDFKKSVEAGRGDQVEKLVSEQTLQHFDKLRRLALTGGADMYQLSIYDEVSIYYLRSQFKRAALEKFRGRDIINILAKNKMLGVADLNEFKLTSLQVEDTAAWANLTHNNLETPYAINFVEESGDWKVDMDRFQRNRENELVMRMMQYGGDRDQVISELLKSFGLRDGLTPALRQPLASS